MQPRRDGRVVKALDSKSNGIFPHRFESCSRRNLFQLFSTLSFAISCKSMFLLSIDECLIMYSFKYYLKRVIHDYNSTAKLLCISVDNYVTTEVSSLFSFIIYAWDVYLINCTGDIKLRNIQSIYSYQFLAANIVKIKILE